MHTKKIFKIVIIVMIISIFFMAIFARVQRADRIKGEKKTIYLQKCTLRELGYYKLRYYYDNANLLEEKTIYFDEMIENPNFQSELEIACKLLNDDCTSFGTDKKFEMITIDRIKNDLQAVNEELDEIDCFLSDLYDNHIITAEDSQYIDYYMKLAEDQLKKSGKYIEWDEGDAAKRAYIDYWTSKTEEDEPNPLKKLFQSKTIEANKKRILGRYFSTMGVRFHDNDDICEKYAETVESKQMGEILEKFEKIMQEENPEIGYGTDYELITTDRLINDYESVYDELTGEMSDKLDEKYETKYYISTIFYHIVQE